jgi:hypothetical protein
MTSFDLRATEYEHWDSPINLGTCDSRAGTAWRECDQRHPGRRHPDDNVLGRLEQRHRKTLLLNSSCLHQQKSSKESRAPASKDAITADVERELSRTSRAIAWELGEPKAVV